MSGLVTIPPADAPAAGNFPLNPAWYRLIYSLVQRVGGVAGPSTEDLTLSQFEDCGIEETKAGLAAGLDELRQLPKAELVATVEWLAAEVSGLRETVRELSVALQAVQQGTVQ